MTVSSTASRRLRINGVVPESSVDGPGLRYAIFTQGCPHGCEGCHNPQTHDFAGGREADADELLAEIERDPLLAGVTLSGGEPFCQAGVLAYIAERVRAMGKNVVTYSGWTLEELGEKARADADVRDLLRATDILIDGRFILAQRDLTLQFRGSANQRVIRDPWRVLKENR